jgi:uncharacterized membrane-anchored protein
MRWAAALLAAAFCLTAQTPPRIQWLFGPATLALPGGAEIAIGPELVYVQGAEALRFLRATGNPTEGHEALVIGARDLAWFAVFSFHGYESLGFVRPNPDVTAIAAAIRRGNEEANRKRRRTGRDTLDVLAWREKPLFNSATGRLEWSLDTRESGGRADENRFVWFLGRQGVISAECVTEASSMARARVEFEQALDGFHFQPGQERGASEPLSARLKDWKLWGGTLLAGAAAVWLRRTRQRGL